MSPKSENFLYTLYKKELQENIDKKNRLYGKWKPNSKFKLKDL